LIRLARRRADFDALPAPACRLLQDTGLSGRTIFLTGATGFVGGWVLGAVGWLNRGLRTPVRVRALSRLPQTSGPAWLTWVHGDVREFRDDAGSDYVLHAALPSAATPAEGARELHETAVGGAHATLEHARRSGVRRYLLLSSGAVYAGPADRALREDAPVGHDPTARDPAYGEAKRAAEALCAAARDEHGLDVAIARLFTCIGPGYRAHRHLAHVSLLEDVLAGRPIRLASAGGAVRSYLYGADLAVWLLRLLTTERPGAIVNVGSDEALTLLEFARLVAHVAGRDDAAVVAGANGEPPAARPYFVPDISTARITFGLAAWTRAADAVRRTLDHLRADAAAALAARH